MLSDTTAGFDIISLMASLKTFVRRKLEQVGERE